MTPEEEEIVRRVLASVPAEKPMPAEVAARLDRILAELAAHRSPEPASDGVVRLEDRRRRRWPQVLVAAAAVSVLGYGAAGVVGGLAGSGTDLSTADSAAEAEDAPALDPDGSLGGSESGGYGAEGAPLPTPQLTDDTRDGVDGVLGVHPGRLDLSLLRRGTLELGGDTLRRDVRRLLLVVETSADRHHASKQRAARTLRPCAVPDAGRGDALAAVRLDGRRATLVLRREVDGARVAEVYSCDDASRLLALTKVPTPD